MLMTATPRELVENTIPVLAVADVPASIRFYCDLLDFKCDWTGSADPPQIAAVSRDGHAIMLQCRSPATPGCVWIGTSGLAELWEKVRLSGKIAVVQRPTNQTFALELKIKDPDGNILWFGTEPLKDVPFGQEPADGEPWES
jgi:catechol 2,3-dioxygenase-like lactoylglutathione lyase family enzyme